MGMTCSKVIVNLRKHDMIIGSTYVAQVEQLGWETS